MINLKLLRTIMLPGLIFQSVVIAGGYSTGRELVEYFLSNGPLGGLFGMLLAGAIWSIVLIISFEFSRITKSYDYKSFFQNLLGKAWVIYEIAYVLVVLLILSVLGAAAGTLASQTFGLPSLYGTLLLIASIGVLTFYGTKMIERALASWSIVLYVIYLLFIIIGFMKFGDRIIENFNTPIQSNAWIIDGVRYAGYNLAIVPGILFCVRHLNTRKEAVLAGFWGGIIGIIPAILTYFVLVGFYPTIVDEPLPVNTILSTMNIPAFQYVFYIVIFGTFIETGTAVLHAINERVAVSAQKKNRVLPEYFRPLIALVFLVSAVFIAEHFGLIRLIGQGYQILTYVFLIVFVLPLFVVALPKIIRSAKHTNT